MTNFITLLLSKMGYPLVGNDIKADLCRVILKLLREHGAQNKDNIYNTILGVLRGPPTLSARIHYERPLVLEALKLQFYLNQMDPQLAMLLMVHYAEGDEDLKADIIEYFTRQGLKDPNGYFKAAMLKIPAVKKGLLPEGQSLSAGVVWARCEEWMEHWIEEFHTNSMSSKSLHPKKQPK